MILQVSKRGDCLDSQAGFVYKIQMEMHLKLDIVC